MEVQGSSWSAHEKKVVAKMEDYLNEHDNAKVEAEELELIMSPEDSEVDLRYILTKASRRCSSIFEIFSTSGSDHLVVSRNRWGAEDCAARDIAKTSKKG